MGSSRLSPGQSQLDFLWTNFNQYDIKNEASDIPSENVLLTEKALTSLIQKATGNNGIVSLLYDDDPIDPTKVRLTGQSVDGSLITMVKMPKESHVVSFVGRQATQVDVDNGFTWPVGSKVLAITLNTGECYLVSLDELNLVISGRESDTIINEVNNGVVASNLKIDNGNNFTSVVKLKTNNNGLYSTLEISPDTSGVVLSKEDNGLKATIPLGTTGYNIKFEQMTLAAYQNLSYVHGVIYFITDMPYIFLDGVRYGINIKPGEVPLVSLVYDPQTMVLAYKKADESDIRLVHLGPVSLDDNGMMTKEQYADLVSLKNALDGITSVSEYVTRQVSAVGVTLEWGNTISGEKELLLKNSFGDTISKVMVKEENYLLNAVSKQADSDDVLAAAADGLSLTVGEQILILTLNNGNKVYVSVASLVDTYTGGTTKTIAVTVSADNIITANTIISPQDKVLYAYNDGLAAVLSVVRTTGKVTIYGRTQTEADKIGEFNIADSLIKIVRIDAADANTTVNYPPRQIDGRDYDPLTNPVIMTYPYLVLQFGQVTSDSFTTYTFNDYLSLQPILNSMVLSSEEGNMLTRDDNGLLYCSGIWKEYE